MGYFQMKHYDWLEAQGIELSPFGREVAYIIGCTFRGIYNAPIDHDTTKWKNERSLGITIDCSLATFDSNALTNLTLFAHEMCIRISVSPLARFTRWNDFKEQSVYVGEVSSHDDIPLNSECCHPCLEIWFYKRNCREGNMNARHPMIEEAVADFRKLYRHPSNISSDHSKGEAQ